MGSGNSRSSPVEPNNEKAQNSSFFESQPKRIAKTSYAGKETQNLTKDKKKSDKGDKNTPKKDISVACYQGFIRRKYVLPKTGFVYFRKTIAERREMHEIIAKAKEDNRNNVDFGKMEVLKIQELKLSALDIPRTFRIDEYDAVVLKVSSGEWFKYRGVLYSWRKMEKIIQNRMQEFQTVKGTSDLPSWMLTEEDTLAYLSARYLVTYRRRLAYPIYKARQHGITRHELVRILPLCKVGVLEEPPREWIVERMKEDVVLMLKEKKKWDSKAVVGRSSHSERVTVEEANDSKYFEYFLDQLRRWLEVHPDNDIENAPPKAKVDLNCQEFPLPRDIKADHSTLRAELSGWEPFDLQVPEEGAWQQLPVLGEKLDNPDEVFAKLVQQCHGDESWKPFDTTMAEDIACAEVETDIVEKDKTTHAQEDIWKKRSTRTNLMDPVWMAKKRELLAKKLKSRYEKMGKSYPVDEYMDFAKTLQNHSEVFQRLCKKKFKPVKSWLQNLDTF